MRKVFHRYSVIDFQLTLIKSSEIGANYVNERASLCKPKVALAKKHY